MAAKVSIICNKCGLKFQQSFRGHIHAKNGCPVCFVDIISRKGRLSQEEYINRVTAMYGHKYNYDDVIYVTLHSYILINCKSCKTQFSQQAGNHLNGHGCSKCNPGGCFLSETLFNNRPFLKNIPSILYLVLFENEFEKFLKIGISSYSVKKRYTTKYNSYIITPIKTVDMPLYEAWQAEQQLLNDLRQHKYTPLTKFGGYTECFTLDILDILIQ